MAILEDKTVVVTGGTGSLGKVLIGRILEGKLGRPKKIVVFSRDESKQYTMRLRFERKAEQTDDIIYSDYARTLQFVIGDVRDYYAVRGAIKRADVVINAAALKQVPNCEYFPAEAVMTNIMGAENIVRAVKEGDTSVDTVVCVSTDKACKPVNVMGMTKAIQERLLTHAPLFCPDTRFVGVRYGNVLASRGSVVPLFHEQIRAGGPVTVTSVEMTRFLLSLNQAVDTIFEALQKGRSSEIYVPIIPSARMIDLAEVLVDGRPVEIKVTGIRPGEKIHESLVSEEESFRTARRGDYYVLEPLLPELRAARQAGEQYLDGKEYSSADNLYDKQPLKELMRQHNLMVDQQQEQFRYDGELLV